ncbi:hypothetical protein N8I77_007243 [Diaporthe amygdali]|uniref:Uncharacterized protein n=1 Tax=Phomopsis amygdali TaxID=1214568 RepID=A0AAD9W3W6_PHOAM|nr:hypothetical protein N8I77_007243 [Diaporthe amygdali]
MRFTNVLIALSSVAGVVSAFQAVNDRSSLNVVDDNVYDNAATTLVPVQLDARAKKGDKKKTTTTSTSTSKAAVATTSSTTTSSAKAPAATTSSVTTSSATTSSDAGVATACSINRRLRFMPRTLERAQKTEKTDGEYKLDENEWITALKVKSGDKISVINVSGCSAVFLWNENDIPSVFHIFCGQEEADGKKAAQTLGDMGSQVEPVSVTIAAMDEGRFNTIRTQIKAEFTFLKDTDFKSMIYDNDARADGERYRFEAVAGTQSVEKKLGPGCSRQTQ